jgi:hypothetical protein
MDPEFQRLVDAAAEVAMPGRWEAVNHGRIRINQYLMQVIPFLGADRPSVSPFCSILPLVTPPMRWLNIVRMAVSPIPIWDPL